MICPYCTEEVPANSQQHDGCVVKNNKFPLLYADYHGGEGSADPVILSVVGFSGHGKTVFLCALFDYLDNQLPYLWSDFHREVLDQESLSRLDGNRRILRENKLPQMTVGQSFPRPGIVRLKNMPRHAAGNGLPPLVDTTVLIYDPPGEAFKTEDLIVQIAGFVKHSSCVLFLIDLTALGESMADEMALLLDTYVLGMRRMGIERKSQHLIVVYTKSDEMKVSVPEFRDFLVREEDLKKYLDEQRPRTLADPRAHLKKLEDISRLLEDFTWSELNAAGFIHMAKDWFASVSFTVVSSLGAAPERVENGYGPAATKAAPEDGAELLDLSGSDERADLRLTGKMSPRGVADPLLYVLAKSLKEPPQHDPDPLTEPAPAGPPDRLVVALAAGGALLLVGLLTLFALWAWSGGEAEGDGNVPANAPAVKKSSAKVGPAARQGMAYVPGGEFEMGRASGDDFERPPHRVAVKPFFIDLYEVTCAEYAGFVEQTGHSPPPEWLSRQCPPGRARRPVTGVSWDDAVAYAKWANKRLPTEEEWEFAARGADGRLYPWGSEWRPDLANAGGRAGGGPADVGAFKGVSPFGLYDMIGNVWEWTASDLKPYPGGRLTVEPGGNDMKVIRGGSWKEDPGEATATYRGYLLARGDRDYSATGFRCAQDLPAAASGGQASGGR